MVSWANFDILEYLSYEDIYFTRVLAVHYQNGTLSKRAGNHQTVYTTVMPPFSIYSPH